MLASRIPANNARGVKSLSSPIPVSGADGVTDDPNVVVGVGVALASKYVADTLLLAYVQSLISLKSPQLPLIPLFALPKFVHGGSALVHA